MATDEALQYIRGRNVRDCSFDDQIRLIPALKAFNQIMVRMGELFMARKVKSDLFKVDFGDTYFTETYMSESEFAKYDKWIAEVSDDIREFINISVMAGDKLSLAYDLENDTIIASCTIRDRKLGAYGAVITARSTDALDALSLLLYKRHIMMDVTLPLNVRSTVKRG